MGLYEAPGDGEAETEPPGVAGVFASRVRKKDTLAIREGNPRPLIDHADLEEDVVCLDDAPRRHPDGSLGRRVADGVRDQVREHLLHAQTVESGPGLLAVEVDLETQPLGLEQGLESFGDPVNHARQAFRGGLENHVPTSVSGSFEEPTDQIHQPSRASLALLDAAPLLGIELPELRREQHPGVAGDHGDGCPQLVAQDREELVRAGQ
jgi:hypothetical protein